MSIANIATSL